MFEYGRNRSRFPRAPGGIAQRRPQAVPSQDVRLRLAPSRSSSWVTVRRQESPTGSISQVTLEVPSFFTSSLAPGNDDHERRQLANRRTPCANVVGSAPA